jgi:hypothetical protein
MERGMLVLFALGLWMLAVQPALCAPLMISPPAGQWKDLSGGKVDPFIKSSNKATVLLFIMTDCPIANSYAPEINRIAAEYSPQGVAFYLVYVDQQVSTQVIQKHFRDYKYKCSALVDPEHSLAKRAGATVSPEAVIIGPQGAILYRGRIDDRVVDFGKVRQQPNRQDLRKTLSALLRGEAIPSARTPCIGCYISIEGK